MTCRYPENAWGTAYRKGCRCTTCVTERRAYLRGRRQYAAPVWTPRLRAKVVGLARYFTGKPCANGHVAERYTYDAHCVECHREQQRARYRTDAYREANRERNRRWARRNPRPPLTPEARERKNARARERYHNRKAQA